MKKINRITKNEDFQKIAKSGKKFYNKSFTVYFLNNNLDQVHIGISVSKKIGCAVIRNKIKRQVRMMCQDIFPIDCNYDVVVVVSKYYIDNNYDINKNNLFELFNKITKGEN